MSTGLIPPFVRQSEVVGGRPSAPDLLAHRECWYLWSRETAVGGKIVAVECFSIAKHRGDEEPGFVGDVKPRRLEQSKYPLHI